VLRKHIEGAATWRLAVEFARPDRFLGGDAFERFEAIAGRQ
jgi:hypothetical protein